MSDRPVGHVAVATHTHHGDLVRVPDEHRDPTHLSVFVPG
jgi:hypothetical protein